MNNKKYNLIYNENFNENNFHLIELNNTLKDSIINNEK